MREGTRVEDGQQRLGTITDTGCGGEMAWVEWEDTGDLDVIERTEDGKGWWAPETGHAVLPRW